MREEGREREREGAGEEILMGWGRGKRRVSSRGRGGRSGDIRREQWTSGGQSVVN